VSEKRPRPLNWFHRILLGLIERSGDVEPEGAPDVPPGVDQDSINELRWTQKRVYEVEQRRAIAGFPRTSR
jgi:hypothetical protein